MTDAGADRAEGSVPVLFEEPGPEAEFGAGIEASFAGAAPPPACCGARTGLDPVTLGCHGYRRVEGRPAWSDP